METVWTLGPLVAEGGALTLQGERTVGSSGLGGRVLHVAPNGRFRLIVARFASSQPTPVHSHKRWGLEVGTSGRERFTVWSLQVTRTWPCFQTTTSNAGTWGTGTTRLATLTGSGPGVESLLAS